MNEAEAREIAVDGKHYDEQTPEYWQAKGYIACLSGPEFQEKDRRNSELRELNKSLVEKLRRLDWCESRQEERHLQLKEQLEDKDRRIQELEKLSECKYTYPCPICDERYCEHNELYQRDKRIKELEEALTQADRDKISDLIWSDYVKQKDKISDQKAMLEKMAEALQLGADHIDMGSVRQELEDVNSEYTAWKEQNG